MKKYLNNRVFLNYGIIVLITLIFVACEYDINSVHMKYLKIPEKSYLTRPDSLIVKNGFERSYLKWYVGADPRIDKLVVKWSSYVDGKLKNDSLVTPVEKERFKFYEQFIPLSEGWHQFSIYNESNDGERSLRYVRSVQVFGDKYVLELPIRGIREGKYNAESKEFAVKLEHLDVLRTVIEYKDINDKNVVMRLAQDSLNVLIKDVLEDAELKVHSLFQPKNSIDSIKGRTVVLRVQDVEAN